MSPSTPEVEAMQARDGSPKIVVSHWVHDEVVDFLSRRCRLTVNRTRESWPRDELLRHCRDADALIAFMPDSVDEGFLAQCPRLRIVASAVKGYDNFDADACTRRGIWLTVVPGMLTGPTAELAVGLTIGLMRRIAAGDERVRSGEFAGWRPILYGGGLAGSIVGILGMGAVGRAIARRLAGFEARLAYNDIDPLPVAEEAALGVRRVSQMALLMTSDVVILTLPLTPETRRLINVDTLSLMKPGSYLVNVGRGSVVDENAVAAALASGQLAGYASDVFAFEDRRRPEGAPTIPAALLEHPDRTLFSAHMGAAVDTVRRDIAMYAARAALQALHGERPQGAVNEPARAAPAPLLVVNA
jgi:phosphonate dehydrogenase